MVNAKKAVECSDDKVTYELTAGIQNATTGNSFWPFFNQIFATKCFANIWRQHYKKQGKLVWAR